MKLAGWMAMLAGLSTGLSICQAGGAFAADTINMRLGDSLPPSHVYRSALSRPLIEAIERRTNGQVKIADFPGSQLGQQKDFLDLTLSGVVDIGYIATAAISDRMPLSAVAELPGSVSTSCDGAMTMLSLVSPGGMLYENEFAPNGIMPLGLIVANPYQIILSTQRSVKTVSDLEGLKIRAFGGAQDLTARGLKTVPIQIGTTDVYAAMSRGTIDGAILGFQAVYGYDLAPLLKATTLNEAFGSGFVAYAISLAKFKQLPENVRDALTAARDEVTRSACKKIEADELDLSNKFQAAGGKIVKFEKPDQDKIDALSDQVRKDWADGLDKRGKPGSATLKAYAETRAKVAAK